MSGTFMEESLGIKASDVIGMMQDRSLYRTSWMGIPAIKCPLDWWVYQEIIWELKPDFIIEVGNHAGGALLSYAMLCDMIGKGTVIGVDIKHTSLDERIRDTRTRHQRIELVTGDASQVAPLVQGKVAGSGCVLVIEDSLHAAPQTFDVLCSYAPMVTVGSYLICEDTIIGHGLDSKNPGPWEAVDKFLERFANFQADRSREGFFLTWNPRGFLKRVA